MYDPPTGDLVDRLDVFGRKLGVLRTPRTSQSLPMPLEWSRFPTVCSRISSGFRRERGLSDSGVISPPVRSGRRGGREYLPVRNVWYGVVDVMVRSLSGDVRTCGSVTSYHRL